MTARPGAGTAPASLLIERCLREPEFVRRYEAAEWCPLGEGRFGCVYRFLDRDLGREVAVKLFWRLTPELRARIRAEVQNAQRIRSELVVQIHTVYFGSEVAWLQMELVEGPDLEQELRRRSVHNQPFTLEEALACAADSVEALAQAHAVGVVHRDIKPSNLLLPTDRRPFVKLGDFGISKHRDAAHLTSTGEFPGSPAYAAPEIFDGQPAGMESDVYSIGLVVFRILAGGAYAYAFNRDPSPVDFLMAHRNALPQRVSDFQPEVPRSVEQALLRALAKSPRDRPAARWLADVLRDAGHPSSAVVVSTPARSPRPWRRPAMAAAGLAVLVAAAVAGLQQWGRTRTSTVEDGAPASTVPATPAPVTQPPAAAEPERVASAPVATPDVPGPALLPPPSTAPASAALASRARDREAARVVAPSVAPPVAPAVSAPSPRPTAASPAAASPPAAAGPAVAERPPAVAERPPAPERRVSPVPVTLAPAPSAPASSAAAASVPEPVPARFRPPTTVVLGGVPGEEAEAVRGRFDFEVRPGAVGPGLAFTADVYLANEGERPLRIEQMDLVTTTNGARSGRPWTPSTREVKARRRERVARVEGRWPAEPRSWSLEVFVRTAGQATLKGTVEWR